MNIITKIWHRGLTEITQLKYKHRHRTARVDHNVCVFNSDNLYMAESTNLDAGAVIMNTRAKFIMKKWSGAAIGLFVVTGNHLSVIGKSLKQVTDKDKEELDVNHEMDKDIVVNEDVWIGSHVTLLSGAQIGRGGIVGSGCVLRGITPPYAVLVGNPAKVVGFRFTPEEIIEHEKALYPEEDRLPFELLEKNYKKYFLDHIKEIKAYTGLICK